MLSLERIQRCGAILSSSAFITQRIPLQAELSAINSILQQCKNEIISVLRDIYSLLCSSHSLPSNAYSLPENEVFANKTMNFHLAHNRNTETIKSGILFSRIPHNLLGGQLERDKHDRQLSFFLSISARVKHRHSKHVRLGRFHLSKRSLG